MVFLSGPGQVVFYSVGLLGFFLQPVARQLIVRRHLPPVKAKFNGASAVFLLLLVNLFVVAWFGYAEIGLLADWAYYLGLSLSILASATYFWGHQSLGRYFSSMVVVYQGHQLVERGPYRFVRHPMYASILLGSIGVGLMAQSWAALAYILISTATIVAYRTSVEEKASSPSLANNTSHTPGASNGSYHSSSKTYIRPTPQRGWETSDLTNP